MKVLNVVLSGWICAGVMASGRISGGKKAGRAQSSGRREGSGEAFIASYLSANSA